MGCAIAEGFAVVCKRQVPRGRIPARKGRHYDTILYRDCDEYPCAACRAETAPTFLCGDGVVACTSPGCCRVADYLCDFPMGGGATCDIPLCEGHRVAQGGELLDIDYCPQHAMIARGMVTIPGGG